MEWRLGKADWETEAASFDGKQNAKELNKMTQHCLKENKLKEVGSRY